MEAFHMKRIFWKKSIHACHWIKNVLTFVTWQSRVSQSVCNDFSTFLKNFFLTWILRITVLYNLRFQSILCPVFTIMGQRTLLKEVETDGVLSDIYCIDLFVWSVFLKCQFSYRLHKKSPPVGILFQSISQSTHRNMSFLKYREQLYQIFWKIVVWEESHSLDGACE